MLGGIRTTGVLAGIGCFNLHKPAHLQALYAGEGAGGP